MLECICAVVPTLHTRTQLALVIHYREARKPTNTGLLAARVLANSRVDIVGDRDRPLALPIVAAGKRGALLFPADDAVPIDSIANAGHAALPQAVRSTVASPANAGRAALPQAVLSTIASPANVGRAALPQAVPSTVASPANAGRAALPEAALSRIDTLVVPDGNWRQAGKFRARVPGLAELPCVRLPDDTPATRYRIRAEPRTGGLATIEAIAYALRVLEGDDVADQLLAIFDALVASTLRARGYSASTR
jgi:DTW domain-containing protein YfiP